MAFKFKVLAGTHVQHGKKYVAGNVVESEDRLDKMFKNKFQRVGVIEEDDTVSDGVELEEVGQRRPNRNRPGVKVGKDAPPEETAVVKTPPKVEKPVVGEPPKGKDVTADFKTAVDQDYKVFLHKKKFFAFDKDTLRPVNAEGVTEEQVADVIKADLGA